jgi:hypothetical protein
MTIDVELTRSVDAPDVRAALTARGLRVRLASDGLGLVVDADDAASVGHLLETWAGESGLPFVPVRVDSTSYALVPPAG